MLDERPPKLRAEWDDLMQRIHDANADLTERIEREGLTAEFVEAGDTLRITIGAPGGPTYSQRVGAIKLQLDDETDQIVGVTIAEITAYAASHQEGLGAMLPALRRFGTIQLPARSAGAELVAQELRELVPA